MWRLMVDEDFVFCVLRDIYAADVVVLGQNF